MERRIEIIDGLRGIASLAVCWFHMTNTYPESSMTRLSGHFGWLGVEVFFVISGFIIPYALYRGNYRLGSDWGRFVVKRIIRLDPPYLIAAVMALVLWYLSSLAPGFRGGAPDISLIQIGLHLGYLNSIFDYQWFNPVFWTLAIEFQFYLLLSLIFPLLIVANPIWRLSVLAALCALAFIFPSQVFVFKHLFLFIAGIAAFQYSCRLATMGEYFSVLVVATLLASVIMNVTIAMIAICTSLVISFVNVRRFKWLAYLGTISYSLYLVHVPVGGRVINLGIRWAETEFQYFLISIGGVFLSLIAAHIFYKYIEKPAQIWSSRIKYLGIGKNNRQKIHVQIEST
jgi:peptidoglycan/LPS O-acetylase OafA/YrhL